MKDYDKFIKDYENGDAVWPDMGKFRDGLIKHILRKEGLEFVFGKGWMWPESEDVYASNFEEAYDRLTDEKEWEETQRELMEQDMHP